MYVLEVLPFKATRQVFSPGVVSAVSRANRDGRRTIDKGEPANFFVYYELDDDESKHNLQLAEHGHQEVPNAWVLLEKA